MIVNPSCPREQSDRIEAMMTKYKRLLFALAGFLILLPFTGDIPFSRFIVPGACPKRARLPASTVPRRFRFC